MVIVGAAAFAVQTPAMAHHAFSLDFDANLPVTLSGPITRVEWINPHTWIHLEHTDKDAKVSQWMVEGGTPNTLLSRGITRNTLKLGTHIVITGYQSKGQICTPKCRANGHNLTTDDGRNLFIGSSGTGAPVRGKPGKE